MSEWILTEVGLPRVGVDVLLYTRSDGIDHGWLDGNNWLLYRTSQYDETIQFDLEQVTHWMPLPDPPEAA